MVVARLGRVEWLRALDGDMYFVQPGQIHYEEITSEHVDLFTLRIDLLDRKGESVRFIENVDLNPQCLRGFEVKSADLFEDILQLIWNEKPGVKKKIESRILWTVQLIEEEFKLNRIKSDAVSVLSIHPPLVEKALGYIQQNRHTKITFVELLAPSKELILKNNILTYKKPFGVCCHPSVLLGWPGKNEK